MPRVPVLTEAVHEQHDRLRPAAISREAFADHRERNVASSDDDFLHERLALVSPIDRIDGLVDVLPEEDQNEIAPETKR